VNSLVPADFLFAVAIAVAITFVDQMTPQSAAVVFAADGTLVSPGYSAGNPLAQLPRWRSTITPR
jgi:hypothetical protein